MEKREGLLDVRLARLVNCEVVERLLAVGAAIPFPFLGLSQSARGWTACFRQHPRDSRYPFLWLACRDRSAPDRHVITGPNLFRYGR